ncbi:MAG: 5'-nucleotidase C-terminal domain-containing protein [Dehalococcoidia bacterium]|nr:5'-nucleotidase C-terminal domain-containing protein [Dehalococcoidia bacterium]
MSRKLAVPALCLTLLMLSGFLSCAPGGGNLADFKTSPLDITILHVGDTHSYVIPHDVMLNINGEDTLAIMGGWSLLAAAVEEIRRNENNVMLLHSGDTIEGTIWSVKFSGLVDFEAMNELKFDAVELGSQEFSRGPLGASNLVNIVEFPVLCANIDVSAEPSLAGRIEPYTILDYEGEKIGLVGLITTDTRISEYPGQTIKFLPVEETARKYIKELNEMGINKIVILSHLGYRHDVSLAETVEGIDIIVGGHSHTLMGGPEFEQIGLNPEVPYPVEMEGPSGDRVLIVHAWKNNQLLGQIKLQFDEKGQISSFSGSSFIPATNSFKLADRNGWYHLCSCQPQFDKIMKVLAVNPAIKFYWTNLDMDAVLQPYINEVANEMNTVTGVAGDDFIRGKECSPGPVVADAFLWAAHKLNPDTQAALVDSRSVQSDIYKGTVLKNDLYMLLPLQHNLVTARLPGSTIREMLEEGINLQIDAGNPPPFFAVSGLKMTIDLSRQSGQRITALQIADADGLYKDLDTNTEYTLVTTGYLADKYLTAAAGRSGWLKPFITLFKSWIKNTSQYQELGIKDVNALIDYFRIQQNIKCTGEERITMLGISTKQEDLTD